MSAKSIAEALAALGVIASLLFVGVEIRQSNAQAKAAAYQAIGSATAEAIDSWAHDPAFATLSLKAPEELTAVEWEQLRQKFTVFARLGEMVHLQIAQGVLDADAMQRLGYRGWTGFITDPKLGCLWPLIEPGVSPEFKTYVEATAGQVPEACATYEIRYPEG